MIEPKKKNDYWTIAEKYKIPFYLHELELPILQNAAFTAKMFGFQFSGINTKPNFISEKEQN
jgi:hypothetical protein